MLLTRYLTLSVQAASLFASRFDALRPLHSWIAPDLDNDTAPILDKTPDLWEVVNTLSALHEPLIDFMNLVGPIRRAKLVHSAHAYLERSEWGLEVAHGVYASSYVAASEHLQLYHSQVMDVMRFARSTIGSNPDGRALPSIGVCWRGPDDVAAFEKHLDNLEAKLTDLIYKGEKTAALLYGQAFAWNALGVARRTYTWMLQKQVGGGLNFWLPHNLGRWTTYTSLCFQLSSFHDPVLVELDHTQFRLRHARDMLRAIRPGRRPMPWKYLREAISDRDIRAALHELSEKSRSCIIKAPKRQNRARIEVMAFAS